MRDENDDSDYEVLQSLYRPKLGMGLGELVFGFKTMSQVALYPRTKAQFRDDNATCWHLSSLMVSV